MAGPHPGVPSVRHAPEPVPSPVLTLQGESHRSRQAPERRGVLRPRFRTHPPPLHSQSLAQVLPPEGGEQETAVASDVIAPWGAVDKAHPSPGTPRQCEHCCVKHSKNDVVEGLLRDIRDIVALLDRVGEEHWADWLRGSARRIEARDPWGVKHLLGAFGGMGSIIDLRIHRANGHRIADLDTRPINDELGARLNNVRQAATGIARDLPVD